MSKRGSYLQFDFLASNDDPIDSYLSQDRNSSSQTIQEVASSALIDSLAAEWWSANLSQTVINDLLENLIPIVVLGCEKVINEADELHLIETTTPDRSFNPINRLASFLMRNNPKYMHFSALSPYHYTMKTLLNTKKIQVLKVYGEEETLLRTILKQRQNERLEHQDVTNQEEERRKNLLKTFFFDWNVPERGWIQTNLINNMLEQSNELSKSTDLKINLPVFQSHRMHLGTFTDNFFNGLKNQSANNFDSIIEIYRRCAQTYSNIVQEHELDLLLQRVFNQLDDKQCGYLLRKTIMKLLQKFYNGLTDQDKRNVNRPDEWPVIKQTVPEEEILEESLPESEKVEEEKPAEAKEPEKPSGESTTNEQEKSAETAEKEKPAEGGEQHSKEKPVEETEHQEKEKAKDETQTNNQEKHPEEPKTSEHEKPAESPKPADQEKVAEKPKPNEQEKAAEKPKTIENKLSATTLADNHEVKTDEKKKVEEPKEEEDDEEKFVVELKQPSAYDPNYRYTREQKSVYNLEHFDTNDQNKSAPYEDELIDKKQFSAMLISFSGLKKNDMVVSALIDFFRTSYKESEEDSTSKKTLLQQRLLEEQRRIQTDSLFEKLNTTCTGLLKLEPIVNILKQYKEGTVVDHIDEVLELYHDKQQLTNEQFFDFLVTIHRTLNEALGGEERFDELLKYIESQQPQANSNDQTRIHTRQKWLKRIRNIPFQTVAHVYKEIMDIIQKDSDTFGTQPNKHLSIYIALLEDDKNHLRYVATTNDQSDLLLGKTLHRDQGISFQVLENGRWAYINQTKNHSRIYFFKPDAAHDSGSFVLMPLKRLQRKYSSGVLGIDTLQDKREKAFVKHEVQFYEGITSILSDTLTLLDLHSNILKIFHRFIYWIKERKFEISSIDYYTYEPTSLNNPQERILYHILTYSNGQIMKLDTPKVINSREQVFKYHLEYAATTCQSTMTAFLDDTHMIQALRGKDNFCCALIDTNIGQKEKLPKEQREDIVTMFQCMNRAVDLLAEELYEDKSQRILNYEKQSEELRLKYLFDRIWYRDVCNKLKEFPSEKLQDFINNKLKSNEQIKPVFSSISQIIKEREIKPADYLKDLVPLMYTFDPTNVETFQNEAWKSVDQSLQNLDRSTWRPPSSDVMKLFANWLNLANVLHQNSAIQSN
ncbi:unnamed protein product [Adineta ricciae]|uniref:Uncharacterized protein n=1 Tax=Adineta ricciae TaxID=249248 RepID=A0A814EGW1_ADIRI|nr:unnamed protein product [Adineta ricciae]